MDVFDAIRTRWACRAFLETPLTNEQIEQVLEAASWSPSGVNSQPWRVAIAQGNSRQAISQALIAAREQEQEPNPDYRYYPDNWIEPYRSRRIECGKALYSALGIAKEDKSRQQKAWFNNYRFFGAPVALFFFIHQQMNTGSWLDMGLFLQNVMLAATGLGLASCPQASVADYPDIIRQILQVDEEYTLICGMALGYADTQKAVNQYRLERSSPGEFCSWHD